MIALGDVGWIFVHTAAYSGDIDVADIDRWHRARGWEAIGYHFLVHRTGEVEAGRSLEYAGAHVEGCNTRSIGVCCEGHGDYEEHTPAQRAALIRLCVGLMERYGLRPEAVLGHREVNDLVDADEVGDHYRTHKTCPGTRVDMDEIRAAIALAGAPFGDADLPEPVVRLVDSLGLTTSDPVDVVDPDPAPSED